MEALSKVFRLLFQESTGKDSDFVAGSGMSLHRLLADISLFADIYRDSKNVEKIPSLSF